MRRAADQIDRVLKQNDYRDTTRALWAVCEYNPLSHPHHCCQITSNLGGTLRFTPDVFLRTNARHANNPRCLGAPTFYMGGLGQLHLVQNSYMVL